MYRIILPIIFSSLLFACSGSGESNNKIVTGSDNILETIDNSSSTPDSTPETPKDSTPEPPKVLSLQTVYKNVCGIETPATDSALIVHGENGSNKMTVYADEQGNISYEFEAETETVTLVTYNDDDEKKSSPELRTFVDIAPIESTKFVIESHNKRDCDCKFIDFTVKTPERGNDTLASTRIFGANNSEYFYETDESKINKSTVGGDAVYENVEVCSSANFSPSLIIENSFSSPDEIFFAVLNDFSVTEVNADIPAKEVTIQNSEEEIDYVVFSWLNNIQSYAQSGLDNGALSVLEQSNVNNFFFALQEFEPRIINSYYIDHSRAILHSPSILPSQLSFSFIDNDFARLLDVLVFDGSSSVYDFTQSGVDIVYIELDGDDHDSGDSFNWEIVTKPSGKSIDLLAFDLSEFVKYQVTEYESSYLNVYVEDFTSFDGYQNTLEIILGGTRPSLYSFKGEVNNWDIEIQLSDSDSGLAGVADLKLALENQLVSQKSEVSRQQGALDLIRQSKVF